MAKIQGFYTLRALLYNKGPDSADGDILYEFTNNNRNASVGSAFECKLNFVQQDATDVRNGLRRFLVNNKLLIKRARVITPGAPGLQPSPGNRAAYILLQTYAEDDNGNETQGNAIEIKLDFFNEWQEFNIWFDNNVIVSGDGIYEFKLTSGYWNLSVDDYNLQTAYEGEPLHAFLELEVDTAGLINTSNRLV